MQGNVRFGVCTLNGIIILKMVTISKKAKDDFRFCEDIVLTFEYANIIY